MSIQMYRDKGSSGTDSEVLVFEVDGEFSASELFEYLDYGWTQAQKQGHTFLAVINTNYTMYSFNELWSFLDRFLMIDRLPKNQPQYRIGLVVDGTRLIELRAWNSLSSMEESPKGLFGWLTLINDGVTMYSGAKEQERVKNDHPLGNNSWVEVHYTVPESMQWCRQNAIW